MVFGELDQTYMFDGVKQMLHYEVAFEWETELLMNIVVAIDTYIEVVFDIIYMSIMFLVVVDIKIDDVVISILQLG